MSPLQWRTVVARCLLGSSVKTVAYTLTHYANPDGTSVRPGEKLLAKDCEMGERTVRDALSRLREVGLIERVVCGSEYGRGGMADEYRLTHPGLEELENRVPMWSPDRSKVMFQGAEVPPPEPRKRKKRSPKNLESPAADAGVRDGSPAADAGVNPADDAVRPAAVAGDTALPTSNHRQLITGTPATDNRNTGSSCRPPSPAPSQDLANEFGSCDHVAEVEVRGARSSPDELDHKSAMKILNDLGPDTAQRLMDCALAEARTRDGRDPPPTALVLAAAHLALAAERRTA